MIGFKSFADKTKLDFEPGMTAIVGPNGCGKSNVSDAMRWVLGEQSAKALRGAQMTDVIFNGTDVRKPLNMAEVSVTFADCDKALGMEMTEVTITRRVFRTGEGQYFINRAPCRLKDIARLFMDTGVGTTSYSVMEQGRIDQILSSRPEDRREVFEEASGITKFKNDKKEALRKLEHTEANLLRLADVIREVKRQIGSLQRQAGKARRYQSLREELRKADVFLTRDRLKALEEEIAAIQAKLTTFNEDLRAAQKEVEDLEEGNSVLRQSVVQTEHEIGTARERAVQAESKLEHTRELIKVNREQSAEYKAMADRDRRDTEATKQQLEQAHVAKDGFAKQVEALKADADQATKALETKTSLFNQHQEELSTARQNLQALRNDLIQLESLATRLQNEHMELEARERSRILERERLAAERGHIAKTSTDLEARLTESTGILEALRVDAHSREQQLEALSQQRIALDSKITEQTRRQSDLQSSRAACQARIAVLRESDRDPGAMPDGTRLLLDSANPLAVDNQFVLGTLASHIEVEPDYVRAVEVSLRACMDAVLVRNSAAALDIVTRLQSATKGSIRLLAVPPGALPRPPEGTRGDQLLDHVKCSEAARPILENLLGSVFVVPAHTDIPSPVPAGIVFATKTGVLARGDGWVEYLVPQDNAAYPIHLRQSIAATEEESRRLDGEITDAAAALEKCRQDLVALDTAIREERVRLDKSARALAQKEGESQVISSEARTSAQKLETVSWELDNLKTQNVSSEAERNHIEEQLRDVRTRREQNAESSATANRDLQRLESRHVELQNDLAETRIRHGEVGQNLRHEESRLESATARIEELDRHLQERSTAIAEYESRIRAMETAVQMAESSITVLEGQVRTEHDKVESLQKNRIKQAEELKRLEEATTTKRSALEELHTKKSALDVGFTEKRMRRQNEVDRIANEYKMTQEQMAAEPEPQWDEGQPAPESLDTYVAELRTKLEAMGPVNLVAIEEYKELEERYSFLTQQEQDLVNSKQQLMEMIRKINHTTTDLFRSTFEKANTNFQVMFEKLFNGGSAKLVLVNEEDILECGIEIIARPPGKRLQNVSLLSGGERTLTAVALLFAIYMIKPSPFCMLDELDAALDEANINRFVTTLQDFLNQSQFVAITHNRKTIAAARVLYGVTMHEKGISGIVSMKFNDAAKEPVPVG